MKELNSVKFTLFALGIDLSLRIVFKFSAQNCYGD